MCKANTKKDQPIKCLDKVCWHVCVFDVELLEHIEEFFVSNKLRLKLCILETNFWKESKKFFS